MRILIVRLTALGDIIHGLPVAAFLKEQMPECHISWLVEPSGLDLVQGNPAIDQALVFPKKKWLKELSHPLSWGNLSSEIGSFFQDLRKPPFDAVLDLQGLLKSAILSVVSGAPLRFGFKGTREGADQFMTNTLDVGDYFGSGHHVVDMNLKLAAYFVDFLKSGRAGVSDIQAGLNPQPASTYINDGVHFPLPIPPAGTDEKIKRLIKRNSVGVVASNSQVVAFTPGTTWSSKIWPQEKWIELGQALLSSGSHQLVLLGAGSELAVNSAIESSLAQKFAAERIINLTGQTNLLELISIFNQVDAVVGADTGPLHLAAATGKCPIIGVFGSTPTTRNGPYGSQCHSVALNLSCQPCFQKNCPLGTVACLKDLSSQLVLTKLLECLSS